MIDIIIAAIFIIFIVAGYKRGLLKSLYGITALAASIIIAYILYPYVKDFIFSGSISENIRQAVQNKYVDPGLSGSALSSSSLPEYMQSMVATGKIGISNALTIFFSDLILNILAFLSVFLVTRLIIGIVGKVLNIIARLPVIRLFDRAGGVVFGLFESLLIIYLVFAFIYAIAPLKENKSVQSYINTSAFSKMMYENNPLVELVMPKDYDNIVSR